MCKHIHIHIIEYIYLFIHVYIHIHIHEYMYIYIYIYMCIYIRTHALIHSFQDISHIHIRMHSLTEPNVIFTHIYTHKLTYIYVCIDTWMCGTWPIFQSISPSVHIHIHVHTYTPTRRKWQHGSAWHGQPFYSPHQQVCTIESDRERKREQTRAPDARARAFSMRWLRLIGSLTLWVSFAKEPYKRDNILPKRLIILRSLLFEAIS